MRDRVLPPIARAGGAALDVLLPPQCLSCRAPVTEPGHLCGTCWAEVDFIDGPACVSCGHPFETPELDGALCGARTLKRAGARDIYVLTLARVVRPI